MKRAARSGAAARRAKEEEAKNVLTRQAGSPSEVVCIKRAAEPVGRAARIWGRRRLPRPFRGCVRSQRALAKKSAASTCRRAPPVIERRGNRRRLLEQRRAFVPPLAACSDSGERLTFNIRRRLSRAKAGEMALSSWGWSWDQSTVVARVSIETRSSKVLGRWWLVSWVSCSWIQNQRSWSKPDDA